MKTDDFNIVTISIRGFDARLEEAIAAIGREPDGFKRKGDKTLPHRSSLILKNSIYYECVINNDDLWDEAILKLINIVGGLPNMERFVCDFSPEYIHVDFCLSLSQNPNQRDGYVSTEVLQQLCKIGASIGFSFV